VNDHTRNDHEHKERVISLGLPGVCADLFDPDVVERVEPEPEPEPEPPTEAEEIDADLAVLNQPDMFKRGPGGKHDYTFPDRMVLLANLRRVTQRRDDVDGVPGRPLATVVETLRHIAKNRKRRKLSALDLAIQAEWTEARAMGEGLVYKIAKCLHLPGVWWYLCGGRRSQLRQQIVALLMYAHAKRWLGFTLSAAAAERCLECSASAWWEAVRWLEAKGLLVRMRRYANGKVRPRDLAANWYGLGPELLKHAGAFLAHFDEREESPPADVAAAEDRYRRQRRDRGRDRRRQRDDVRRRYENRDLRTRPGRDAPAWTVRVAHAARAHAEDQRACARGRAIRRGEPYSGPVPDLEAQSLTERQAAALDRLGAPPPEPPPEPCGPLCASSGSRASPATPAFSTGANAEAAPNQYHPVSGWAARAVVDPPKAVPEESASSTGPPVENAGVAGDARDPDDAQSGPQGPRTHDPPNEPRTTERAGPGGKGCGREISKGPRREVRAAARDELGRSFEKLRERNPALAARMAREVLEGGDR
jgi:hypothetical protein